MFQCGGIAVMQKQQKNLYRKKMLPFSTFFVQIIFPLWDVAFSYWIICGKSGSAREEN